MSIEIAKSRLSPIASYACSAVSLRTGLLTVHGLYYLLTGVWPLVSIRTFQAVTGPKTDHWPTGLEADHWLVMTVGVLVTAAALALLTAAWRKSRAPEIAVLAIGSAVGLTAIDLIYVARRVIEPIYLLDAAIEVALIAVWAVVLLTDSRRRNGLRT
jgi:hypothetical protein